MQLNPHLQAVQEPHLCPFVCNSLYPAELAEAVVQAMVAAAAAVAAAEAILSCEQLELYYRQSVGDLMG